MKPPSDSLDIFDVSPPGSLTPTAYQEMLAAGSGRIAFCAGPHWERTDIPPEDTYPEDIVVIAARPHALGGGSHDLVWRIWEECSAIAALLSRSC